MSSAKAKRAEALDRLSALQCGIKSPRNLNEEALGELGDMTDELRQIRIDLEAFNKQADQLVKSIKIMRAKMGGADAGEKAR